MSLPRIESLRIKAKLLQKIKKKAGKSIRLSEAFETIAKTAGYASWRELKAEVERHALLHPTRSKAYWNTWYHSYEQAQHYLQEQGGFLLPFEKDYFICDIHYIEKLGISRDDEDLKKVGSDWVNPADPAAYDRLLEKIKDHEE